MSIPCKSCDNGILEDKRDYIRNGCLVTIGYFLLVPSILLALILAFLILMGATENSVPVPSSVDRPAEAQMRLEAVQIPAPLIEKILLLDPLDPEDLEPLSKEQREAVTQEQIRVWTPALGQLLGELALRFIAALLFASVLGALLGWILVLKKKVLRCSSCGVSSDAPETRRSRDYKA